MRVFSENVSAVKTRPEFDAMIAAAHRGKFEVLVVWSLDRLHRSMVGALQTVLDLDVVECRSSPTRSRGSTRAVRCGACSSGSSGGSPSRSGSGIGDRTKAELERARRRGVLGLPRVDLGMDRLLALRAGGMSMSRVAILAATAIEAAPAVTALTSPAGGVAAGGGELQ